VTGGDTKVVHAANLGAKSTLGFEMAHFRSSLSQHLAYSAVQRYLQWQFNPDTLNCKEYTQNSGFTVTDP